MELGRVQPEVESAQRGATILWGAFAASTVIIGALTVFLPPGMARDPFLILALSIAAALTAAAAIIARYVLFSDAQLSTAMSKPFDAKDLSFAQNRTVDEKLFAKLSQLSTFEQRLYLVLRRGQSVMIVLMALNESIAMYGVVLRVQGGGVLELLPFSAGALVLHLFSYPRIEAIVQRAAELPAARQSANS